MRIIGGKCRGRKLSPLTGDAIRPTPDRVREAVFSSLLSRFGSFSGMKVLDLFAGTGAISLEALSRGAISSVMIDKGKDSASIIKINSEACRLSDCITFIAGDVLKTIPAMADKSGPFDLICLDPPYNLGLANTTLELLTSLDLLSPDGIIYIETEKGADLPEAIGRLQRTFYRAYGSVAVHFYEINE